MRDGEVEQIGGQFPDAGRKGKDVSFSITLYSMRKRNKANTFSIDRDFTPGVPSGTLTQ